MKGRSWWVSGALLGGVVLAAAIAAAAAGAGSAAADDACGAKENPCPLQKWMRQSIAAANASGDMATLASDFDKLSKITPDPKWMGADAKANWDAISKAGQAAAKANDPAAVKAACKSCHDVFKEKYKAQFRLKPPPA